MSQAPSFSSLTQATESLLGRLADEFLEAERLGTPRSVEDIANDHPALADVIRETFPAMLAMRQSRPAQPVPIELPELGELGDFRLIRQIGRGGMGIVYEAYQQSLSRKVALKVLPLASTLDERRLRRFQNEARAAAALQHPRIVSVHGVGCERGVHYYAMQLIDGQSLAELMHAEAPPREGDAQADPGASTAANALFSTQSSRGGERYRAVANLGIQAAEALAYAHCEGVVHRDIKPSNLLLDRQGKLWVTDFGLARMQAGGDLSQTGDILGTLRYMSPEQLTDSKVVDQRADVYSLGLTLYELLARRAAFDGVPREQLAQQVLDAEPTPLGTIDASIPVDLETIVLRATAKDRDARYQSADDLAADLRRFVEHKPIVARRLTRWKRLRYWARRNPALAAALAALMVTMTLLSVGGLLSARRQAQLAASTKRNLNLAHLNQAYEAWYSGNTERSESQLNKVETSGVDPPRFAVNLLRNRIDASRKATLLHRDYPLLALAVAPNGRTLVTTGVGGPIMAMHLDGDRLVREISAHNDEGRALSFSPDGAFLASASEDKTLRIWETPIEGEAKLSIPMQDWAWSIAFSPSCDRVAVGLANGVLEVWSLSGERQFSADAHDGLISGVAFSPDGSELATCSFDGTVKLWNASNGELVRPLTDNRTGSAFCAAFTRDGSRLIVGCIGGVRWWDTTTWQEVPVLQYGLGARQILSVAVSHHGILAVGGCDDVITLWDLTMGLQLDQLLGHRGDVTAIAFSPDGSRLYSACSDGDVREFDITRARDLRDFFNARHTLLNAQVDASEDNRTAVSVAASWLEVAREDGKLICWDISNQRKHWEQEVGVRDTFDAAISPDAREIATCGDGGVTLWNGRSGERIQSLLDRKLFRGAAIDYSPDGRWLAAIGTTWKSPADSDAEERPGQLLIWDRAHPERAPFESLSEAGVRKYTRVTFTADSKQFALATGRWRGGNVDLWRLTGDEWEVFLPQAATTLTIMTSAYIIPNTDEFLVTEREGCNIHWLTNSRVRRSTVHAESQNLNCAALSADGSILATASTTCIQLWDVQSGERLANLPVPGAVNSLAFTPDGNTLIWGAVNGSVHFERATR